MTKISDLTALTGAGVDTAADLLPIVDMSLAGTARNKKILVSELGNALAAALAYTNEQAQDAVGAMVDASLTYVDATPLLQRAALTGDVTASAGSNATTIANNAVSFAKFVAAPSVGVVWASGAGNYAHSASGGGLTNFLRADGTWAAPPGSGGFTAASTTEILTGTDSAKGGTPDSIAALWEQGSDVASSGTISIGEGGYFNITGTTTITDIDFATDKAGRKAWVKFAGILTLTHNASTLILPTGASITTAAGDTACFVSEGSDVVRCVAYNRASGAALVGSGALTLDGAKVRKSATLTAQNLTGAGAAVTFNTEDWDTGGYHDTGSNTDRLTPPSSGYYRLRGQVYLANVTSGSFVIAVIRRYNSSAVLQETIAATNLEISATGDIYSNLSGTANFASGDFARLFILSESDTSVDITTDTWFEISKVG